MEPDLEIFSWRRRRDEEISVPLLDNYDFYVGYYYYFLINIDI